MSDVLLIIDVQQALLDELAPPRRAELLQTLVSVLDRARAKGLPVVYVRHDGSPDELVPGTPGWQIGSEIAPRAGEPIVDKRFGDAFVETTLSDVLAELDADHLIAAGMQTDYCVNATIGGAAERGFRITLVADGHATYPSNGKTEQEIRDEMHARTQSRGARIAPAAELFG
jgi:nicotinamidase-related amidase